METKSTPVWIGVDFSMNSTGVCIYHDHYYEFMLFPRSVHKKITLQEIPFPIHAQNNVKEYENYSDGEREKLKDAILLSELITSTISSYLASIDYKYQLHISLEGISFGSKGSSFVDIVGYQWILRKSLYDTFKVYPTIFSPQTIKKTAGGGRLNKEGMHQKFFEIDDPDLKNSDLYKWIQNPYNDTQLKKIKVDDMIDAYWSVKTDMRIQEENGKI
jgi:hypothetical protein